MNIRTKNSLLISGLLLGAVSLQGCYGKFALTDKIYKWNGTLGDKWVNSIVMIAFNIVPVYGISILADAVIFNDVEFWTGKNPIAMGPNDKETRTVSLDGKTFILTATQNQLTITPTQGNTEPATVIYRAQDQAWYVDFHGQEHEIAKQDQNLLTLLYPDGHKETLTR